LSIHFRLHCLLNLLLTDWDVDHLLSAGAEMNVKDAYQRTPLMLAAQDGRLHTCIWIHLLGVDSLNLGKLLLDRGADVQAVGMKEQTALHLAVN
jgi:ankyrin repeat protein